MRTGRRTGRISATSSPSAAKLPAAEAEYRAALKLDPRFVPASVNLAELQRTQGLESDAEATLRTALEAMPDNADLHHALGLSLVRQQRQDEALRELAAAARAAPGNARYAFVYAVALHSTGRVREAIAELERGLAAAPADRDILEALAQFLAETGDERRAAGDQGPPATTELKRDIAMKSLTAFLKMTIVGGALYLIPIVLILVVLGKVHGMTIKLVAPIAQGLELHDIGGVNAARLLAIVVVVLACFLAGLFARTAVAQQFVGWLERAILSNLPGYSLVSTLGADVAGTGDEPIPHAGRAGADRGLLAARIAGRAHRRDSLGGFRAGSAGPQVRFHLPDDRRSASRRSTCGSRRQ